MPISTCRRSPTGSARSRRRSTPLVARIEAHVRAAERIHADDTTRPGAGQGQDPDRPAVDRGARRPALWRPAIRRRRPTSTRRDARGEHPEQHGWPSYAGLMQADAYRRLQSALRARPQAGADRRGGMLGPCAAQVLRAGRLRKAPLAIETVEAHRRHLCDRTRHQRASRPRSVLPSRRSAAARSSSSWRCWLRDQRAKLSSKSDPAKAIDYMLKRWPAFTRFLDDGRLCMSNNAAERAVRAIAVGRRNWTFAGSDAGGRRAAAMYTLIETAKLNDIDPAGLARRRPRAACRIIPARASTNCCPGTGAHRTSRPRRPNQSRPRQKIAAPRGFHRTRTRFRCLRVFSWIFLPCIGHHGRPGDLPNV